MASIGPEDVERIADLARLELTADEKARMLGELGAILRYVESLNGVETDGIEPTAHPFALATPLREDRAAAPLDPERALGNAPQREDSAFVVPKVLDEDEA